MLHKIEAFNYDLDYAKVKNLVNETLDVIKVSNFTKK